MLLAINNIISIITLLVFPLLQSVHLTKTFNSPHCPSLCSATDCVAGMLLCDRPGLSEIPHNPPRSITQVILRYQNFASQTLTYMNLSRYGPEDIALQQLVISHCQLISIEPEAFSHLIYLKDLDLSHNRLGIILPNTFKSLALKQLNLDGNFHIELTEKSFKGLLVSSLSMENCSLIHLEFDTVKEISGYLSQLKLANNQIQILSNKFEFLFNRLELLQLYNNPFNCSCQMRWFAATLQRRLSKFPLANQNQALPTCVAPANLHGAPIIKLSPDSFLCLVPKIKKIELKITSDTTAELSCFSDTSSNSQIKWRYKFIKSELFYRYSDTINKQNQAFIKVTKQSESDFYTCLIINENGNATVDIKIKWPSIKHSLSESSSSSTSYASKRNLTSEFASLPTYPPIDSPYHNSKGILPEDNNSIKSTSNSNYLWLKQYTFMEMILAICGTFISTIISFVVLYALVSYRRSHLQTKHHSQLHHHMGYDVALYSDSQTYDIPQISPYHESSGGGGGGVGGPVSCTNTARLLDFKTQREIIQSASTLARDSPRYHPVNNNTLNWTSNPATPR